MGEEVSDEKLWSWVDREAPELGAYLQEHPDARARVDEIRSAMDSVRSSSPHVPARIPERIGGYRIVRLLGEGGMGRVYEAEQQSPHRLVALKVLKHTSQFDERQSARCEQEGQVLARLRHPSIAPIYEAGWTEDGFYYFSMELARGPDVCEYATANKLDLRDRLTLFLSICEAVEYAHGQGVIHRDLKPSNIIIDDEGAPRILDFGLARIVDPESTVVSTRGDRLFGGTLPYMSPEQARGDPSHIDPRSDVYSLGVVLYQITTGRLPFDLKRTAALEGVRIICEQPPPKPSTTDRSLRGDLDTILLKALEKEPEHRYQSPRLLADDISRYLRGEPIRGRRPGLGYLTRRWVGRHRKAVGAAVIVAAAAIAGVWGHGIWSEYQRAMALTEARFEAQRAQRLLEAGDVEPALRPALAIYAEYPELPEAPLVWAQARFRMGRRVQGEDLTMGAIETLRTEIEQRPEQPAYRALLAEIFRVTGAAVEGGGQDFDREIADSGDAWYVYSFATLDPREAVRRIKEAVLRDPNETLIRQRQAYLCLLTGDYGGARIAARTLIGLGRSSYEWSLFEGHTLMFEGRFTEAVEQYRRTSARDPARGEAYRFRGTAYLCLESYGNALPDLTRAVNIAGRSGVRERELRAMLCWIVGRAGEAAEDYRWVRRQRGHASMADARLYLVLREEAHGLELAGNASAAAEIIAEAEQVLQSGLRGAIPGSPLAAIFQALAGQQDPASLVEQARRFGARELCEALFYAGEVESLAHHRDRAMEAYRRIIEGASIFRPDQLAPDPLDEYHLARWRHRQLDEQDGNAAMSPL